ncbi:hypothetical protein BCR42DRAFT_416589 [Absidia repens]|uniref:Uncharacterized protein n=1 Tax=Absidia repens TaxID=90262 RepID=A0A1X2IG81_9FUNG|nr:hypothetical protein BCR42DRAFT_416589 [Absidia repens]
MFCLSRSQQEQEQQLQLQQCQEDNNGPNAFDLTWRNYLPSTSHLFSCLPSLFYHQHQGIQLDDSDDNHNITPLYYNDYYQAYDADGYLNDHHNGDVNGLLSIHTSSGDNQQKRPTRQHKTCTRKLTKRSKRRKYPRQRHIQYEPYNGINCEFGQGQGELNDDGSGQYSFGYYQQQQQPIPCQSNSGNGHHDAVYLSDDQLIKMMNHYNSKSMTHSGSPRQNGSYTPQAGPFMINDDNQNDLDSTIIPSSPPQKNGQEHITLALAAQAILSETLGDFTEKLASIRNNMMDIGTSASASSKQQHNNIEDVQQKDHNNDETTALNTSIEDSSERNFISSDLDYIDSEPENASFQNDERHHSPVTEITTSDYHNSKRLSTNATSDLYMPLPLHSSTSSYYGPSSHPFTYFTE